MKLYPGARAIALVQTNEGPITVPVAWDGSQWIGAFWSGHVWNRAPVEPEKVVALEDALIAASEPRATGLLWIPVQFCLPKLRTVTRKTPNGILVRFNNGNIRHLWEVTETLLYNMRNGPRQPTKYEAPAPARITHWLDLDAAESGPGGEA